VSPVLRVLRRVGFYFPPFSREIPVRCCRSRRQNRQPVNPQPLRRYRLFGLPFPSTLFLRGRPLFLQFPEEEPFWALARRGIFEQVWDQEAPPRTEREEVAGEAHTPLPFAGLPFQPLPRPPPIHAALSPPPPPDDFLVQLSLRQFASHGIPQSVTSV